MDSQIQEFPTALGSGQDEQDPEGMPSNPLLGEHGIQKNENEATSRKSEAESDEMAFCVSNYQHTLDANKIFERHEQVSNDEQPCSPVPQVKTPLQTEITIDNVENPPVKEELVTSQERRQKQSKSGLLLEEITDPYKTKQEVRNQEIGPEGGYKDTQHLKMSLQKEAPRDDVNYTNSVSSQKSSVSGTFHYPEECFNLNDNFGDVGTSTMRGSNQFGDEEEKAYEQCCNGRFMKHEDLISTSKYRTIFRGYDNESGCEIAWNVYSLENVEPEDREKIVVILDTVKQLKHQNILTCIHYMMKETQLVMITELVTAGTIREYLKKIKLPRLVVIKNWCQKILNGVSYLHSQNFIHGKVTCESIYINSNNGDIKIGDIGIRSIPCYNNKYSEVSMCRILKNSEEAINLDVFCFGLSLLEMISSDVSGTQAFKVLCKIINKGEKQQILESIIDEKLRDLIAKALEEDPVKRSSIKELLKHPFLQRSDNDHNPVQLSNQLAQLISKYSSRRQMPTGGKTSNKHSSAAFDSMTSSQLQDSSVFAGIQKSISKSQLKDQATTPRVSKHIPLGHAKNTTSQPIIEKQICERCSPRGEARKDIITTLSEAVKGKPTPEIRVSQVSEGIQKPNSRDGFTES